MLFNPNSRALAITTLLNDPTEKQTVFGFTPAGKYIPGDSKSDAAIGVEPRFTSGQNRSYIDFYDTVSRQEVARAWLNLTGDTSLNACSASSVNGLSDCNVPQSGAYVVLKSSAYASISQSGNTLSLTANGNRVFSVDSMGRISKDPSVSLAFSSANTANLLAVDITAGNTYLGTFGIKFNSDSVAVADDLSLPSVLTANASALVFQQSSGLYGYASTFLGNSTQGKRGISFFRIDGSSTTVDGDLVGNATHKGFENYPNQA